LSQFTVPVSLGFALASPAAKSHLHLWDIDWDWSGALPIILIILRKGRGALRAYHPIRLLGLGGALAALACMGCSSAQLIAAAVICNPDASCFLLTAGSYFHFAASLQTCPLPKPASRTPLRRLVGAAGPIMVRLQLGSPFLQPADAVLTKRCWKPRDPLGNRPTTEERYSLSLNANCSFLDTSAISNCARLRKINLWRCFVCNQALLERFYRISETNGFA
jgi:hypothetical protein